MSGETPKQKLDEKRFRAGQKPEKDRGSKDMLDAWFDSIPEE